MSRTGALSQATGNLFPCADQCLLPTVCLMFGWCCILVRQAWSLKCSCFRTTYGFMPHGTRHCAWYFKVKMSLRYGETFRSNSPKLMFVATTAKHYFFSNYTHIYVGCALDYTGWWEWTVSVLWRWRVEFIAVYLYTYLYIFIYIQTIRSFIE